MQFACAGTALHSQAAATRAHSLSAQMQPHSLLLEPAVDQRADLRLIIGQ